MTYGMQDWVSIFTTSDHTSANAWKLLNEAWCYFHGAVTEANMASDATFLDDQIAYSIGGHSHKTPTATGHGTPLTSGSIHKAAFDLNACSIAWGSFDSTRIGIGADGNDGVYLILTTRNTYAFTRSTDTTYYYGNVLLNPFSAGQPWYSVRDTTLIAGATPTWKVVAFVPMPISDILLDGAGVPVVDTPRANLTGLGWWDVGDGTVRVLAANGDGATNPSGGSCTDMGGLWVLKRSQAAMA